MNKRTLTALQGSITKWTKIVAGTTTDLGSDNCPLCKEFPLCHECPVMKRTRMDECRNTPYIEWESEFGINSRARSKRAKELAQAELDFLKSLLP